MKIYIQGGFLIAASLLCVVWSQCVRHQPLSPCASSRFEYDCTDCTAFWKCDRGRWINAQCVPGTAFHPTLNTCVDRSTVPSCWGQPVQAAPNEVVRRKKRQSAVNCNAAIECPQNVRTMFIPDFDDCNHFYVCNYGQLEDHYCRQYGYQYYNPKNINCEVGSEYTGTPAPTDNICVNRV